MSELLQTMDEWRGRTDAIDGEAGRRWHQVVRPAATAGEPGVALLGFACDAGVKRNHGRCGAAAGPRAVRKYLANLAWHGGDGERLYDAGDVACRDDGLEAAQAAYAGQAAALLRAGHRVIGLGGGHEIAWASYQAIAAALRDDPRLARIGIVNFDAHFDLRQPERAGHGSSGTPFLQIAESRAAAGLDFRYLCLGVSETANTPALYARAAGLGVRFVPDVEIGDAAVDGLLRDFVRECDAIYCTFCLDVLPPAVAPGVSAPSGLGIPLHRALALLRLLRRECRDAPGGDRLVLADIAELAPCFDAPDARTARTAARIAYELAAVGDGRGFAGR
jgi:formiminoglutamase